MAAKETLVDAVRSIRGRNLVRGLGLARGRIPGPRDWAIWELPRWVACFVILVVLTDAVVLTVEASKVSIRVHELALFAGLLICSAATVELTRRVGENLGFVKDVYAVWELPVAMLLPLAYVPVLPLIRFALTQWQGNGTASVAFKVLDGSAHVHDFCIDVPKPQVARRNIMRLR